MNDTYTATTPIYHCANTDDAIDAQNSGRYSSASLATEGFIHCCNKEQLRGVVERYYQDTDKLTLLVIDTGLLEAPLVRENTLGGDELFPHVYGEINMGAVTETIAFDIGSRARTELFSE